MQKVFVMALLIGLLSVPLLAQDRVEVFAGYQYLHTGTITVDGQSVPGSSQGFNGWDASVRGNLSRYLGVEGDFSGTYGTNDGFSRHVYTYTGGPVVSAKMGVIKPFAHALVGGLNLGSSEFGVSISRTAFTMMAGGGVDAKVNKNISIRLGQVDWLFYHFGNAGALDYNPAFSQSNNVRISSGIVFHF
jgi:opacity protein-like surface antigen